MTAGVAEKKTILVIEDEHQTRTLLALILEQAGHRVLEAAHPTEAAHVWKKELHSIDIIIADVWLPGISGPELAGFFRRERPQVKTVFVTGMTTDIRPEFGKLIRGSEIVRKPFKPAEILEAISRSLEI